jgi:hypothetical protein
MQTITAEQFESMREIWRADMLYQMDRIMERLDRRAHPLNFGDDPPGATDGDLPGLFRVLDAQLVRNLARAGVTVEDAERRDDPLDTLAALYRDFTGPNTDESIRRGPHVALIARTLTENGRSLTELQEAADQRWKSQ